MVRTWDCSSNKDHWEKKQIIMLLSYLESCSVVVDESEAVTAPREKNQHHARRHYEISIINYIALN